MVAQFAPDGSLHYMLGHLNASRGPFSIPVGGKQIELKVREAPLPFFKKSNCQLG